MKATFVIARKIFLIFLLLFFAVETFAEGVKVNISGRTVEVETIWIKSLPYLSARDFATKTSNGFYYNSKTKKAELKINDYRIVLTAWNQFVVIRKKNNIKKSVVQLPVSVKFYKGEIYFPLNYLLPYLEMAFGKSAKYEVKQNLLAFTSEPYKSGKKSKSITAENKNSHADIYGIEIEEKANGTLVRIKSRKYIRGAAGNIMNNKLILLLPRGVTVDKTIASKLPKNDYIRKAEVKNVNGNYQIDFTLRKKFVSTDVYNDLDSRDLLVTLYNQKTLDDLEEIERQKQKWKFDVVVIDAGHGGKDPGASYRGIREKDINLAVALKAGKLIEKNLKGVKVVYTRKTDKFVELRKRGQIANKSHGDLFISIHCNSTKKVPTNASGFEVYLLRPGKTKEAIAIAEKENSVINYESNPQEYKKLLDENYILVAMARSAFMRYSEKFAELLSEAWPRKTKLKSRGVKQAGLIVLIGASMPGVLIETGFLTNPRDARYLNSKRGQNDMARAIFEAVKKYKNYYDKIFED